MKKLGQLRKKRIESVLRKALAAIDTGRESVTNDLEAQQVRSLEPEPLVDGMWPRSERGQHHSK